MLRLIETEQHPWVPVGGEGDEIVQWCPACGAVLTGEGHFQLPEIATEPKRLKETE